MTSPAITTHPDIALPDHREASMAGQGTSSGCR